MTYNQFTMAQVQEEYQLEFTEQAAIFADAPPAVLSDWLRARLPKQTAFALRSGSEKASSEYIIAPILIEVYEQMQERVNLFSGVKFDVDEQRRV